MNETVVISNSMLYKSEVRDESLPWPNSNLRALLFCVEWTGICKKQCLYTTDFNGSNPDGSFTSHN